MTRTATLVLASAILASGCSAAGPASPTATAGASTPPPPTAEATATAAPASPATPTSSPTASAQPSPVDFTSPRYGYSVTLPAGWTAVAAMLPWDGSGAPGHEEAVVDQFGGVAGPSAWAFAGPTKSSLAALVTDLIAATYRDHGDTCPKRPEVNTAIRIDGSPARFLAWNCGILINAAVTVRDGTEYVFSMRDVGVHAATDPGDRAIFDALLGAVRLAAS